MVDIVDTYGFDKNSISRHIVYLINFIITSHNINLIQFSQNYKNFHILLYYFFYNIFLYKDFLFFLHSTKLVILLMMVAKI
jgi:hypothetical protein